MTNKTKAAIKKAKRDRLGIDAALQRDAERMKKEALLKRMAIYKTRK